MRTREGKAVAAGSPAFAFGSFGATWGGAEAETASGSKAIGSKGALYPSP